MLLPLTRVDEAEGTIELEGMRFEPNTIAAVRRFPPATAHTAPVSCCLSLCEKALWP